MTWNSFSTGCYVGGVAVFVPMFILCAVLAAYVRHWCQVAEATARDAHRQWSRANLAECRYAELRARTFGLDARNWVGEHRPTNSRNL